MNWLGFYFLCEMVTLSWKGGVTIFESIYFQIAIELTAGFIGLLISVQIVGKRQVSQITPFDFISAIVVGELVGNAIYDPNTSYYHILYTIGVWTLLIFIVEKVTLKYYKSRRLIQGSPTLLIKNGKIDFDKLTKEGLDFSEFLSMLREKDTLSIKEVEFAILETSGNVTVIKKSKYNQPTLSDLNVSGPQPVLNLPVILDGDVVPNNLKLLGYNEEWLQKKLKEQKINSPKDILYAEWNDNEGLFIQKKTS